jgi:glycosyltransferase involved in cell wall biosynthesis
MNGNGSGNTSICVLPRLEGLGGPASFRARLASGLARRGIQTIQDPMDPHCKAVLVIGATRNLGDLFRLRRRGLRLVQRLNGMNWVHRRKNTGVKHFLRSEWANFGLSFIRGWLADQVVYQSNFARQWWQTVYGGVKVPTRVIYNGVDLDTFRPDLPHDRPSQRKRILLVEGRLGSGYEIGLRNAVGLVRLLAERDSEPVELMVVGQVPDALQRGCEIEAPGLLRWQGVVKRDEIARIDRSAHLLFSGDLNAACPNSVIEALASGLPVVAFATGALPELVEGDAGRVVPWGSNYWKLEQPDLSGLADAAEGILAGQERFRAAARARAEEAFSLDTMVDQYLNVLLG